MTAIPAIIALVGTGVSYAASRSAANTQETFSKLNAMAGMQEAQQQSQMAAMQSTLQETQAQVAQQSAQENAEALRQQAEVDAQIQNENIRRKRDDFAMQLAQATAQAGSSGAVIAAGSPLDMLVNAAAMENQEEQTARYGINAGRQAAMREAAGVAIGGRIQGLNASIFNLEGLASLAAGRTAAAQARLGGYAGAAQAGGMRSQAFGGLISGVGGAASSYMKTTNWYQNKYGSGAGPY